MKGGSSGSRASTQLPAAVYRDLVAPLFTMQTPILGFGILLTLLCSLIYVAWQDAVILLLGMGGTAVTIVRLLIIGSYRRNGGAAQPIADLRRWEWRYAAFTFIFALLLAGLNVRVLMVHQPLMLTGTISLVFTFGAGVVSRTACRPRICVGSLLIAVVPTAVALLTHAAFPDDQPLHREFFALLGVLLLTVLAMSLDSVRHLHAAMLEQLITKYDLAELARNDALTGLPNRLMLRSVFLERFQIAQTQGAQVAIHCLDLDDFKLINDQYGHPTGDKLLQEVAARLLSTVRQDDVAVRLGGDEFVIVQASVRHRDEAEMLARRIIKRLSDEYMINDEEMHISASIGIALARGAENDLDDLIACADEALYRSKARGKSQVQFCQTTDHARSPSRTNMHGGREMGGAT
jgi:diguanylate cyclase (GGDEF)-like protein